MKLGVSYNVFDGLELLRPSIENIRPHADYLSIVYQVQSNYGQVDASVETVVADLFSGGLVDEIMLYSPDFSLSGADNELIKRNIGLALSRYQQCTHYLSMDCDEFYEPSQMTYAKKIIDDGVDRSSCGLVTYYRFPYLAVDPPEKYDVTFISRIWPNSEFILNGHFPVLVDPTRRMNDARMDGQGIFCRFSRREIVMHHFSYVRNNLRKKLENSSAKPNFEKAIDQIVDHYDRFGNGDEAMFAGDPPAMHRLKKVNQLFLK